MMRLQPQIRLESTSGQIAIRTTPGSQTIEQPKAELSIQQPPAELTINRTPARLTIDQTQMWEELGFKSTPRLIEDFALQGKSDILEGIGRRAAEGGELMRIENKGNPIPTIAHRNTDKTPSGYNIKFIPSYGSVKVSYEKAKLDVEWKTNKPVIEADTKKPIVGYEPGHVEVSMERWPSLKTDFVNVNFNGTA